MGDREGKSLRPILSPVSELQNYLDRDIGKRDNRDNGKRGITN
jgi:hypothetical protein